MLRFLAGAASCFLLMTGAFLIWQSHAAERPGLPDAPPARGFGASMLAAQPLQAPESLSLTARCMLPHAIGEVGWSRFGGGVFSVSGFCSGSVEASF